MITLDLRPELLPLRLRPAVRLDDDALFELCASNGDLRIERLADGDLIVMAPTGGETGRRSFEILRQLGAWERFLALCPDFVVELRSPSDGRAELHAKVEAWIANGARLAFLVDPTAREVVVYRPGQPPRVERGPTVSADPELPGFSLDVRPVW